MKKMTPKEKGRFLLKHFKDERGDLDLSDVDLSDFEGNVWLSAWKVKKDLHQSQDVVGGDLYQRGQVVKGDLYQSGGTVGGDVFQDSHIVGGDLCQGFQTVGKKVEQDRQKARFDIRQENQIAGGAIHQNDQAAGGIIYQSGQSAGMGVHQDHMPEAAGKATGGDSRDEVRVMLERMTECDGEHEGQCDACGENGAMARDSWEDGEDGE